MTRGHPGKSRLLHDPGEHRDNCIDVLGSRVIPEAQAERPTGSVLRQTHGQENVRGLGNTSLAGRARGNLDSVLVQEVEQNISFTPRHGDVEVSRQPRIERSPHHNLWHRCAQLGAQRIPKGTQSFRTLQAQLFAQLKSRGKSDNTGRVEGSLPASLLFASMNQRAELGGVTREH